MRLVALLPLLLAFSTPALAQYTPSAGRSAPTEPHDEVTKDAKGHAVHQIVEVHVANDGYGNAAGNQHDLAIDGAFEGQTVAVIQLYTGTDLGVPFDFEKPRAALKEKGFSVYRWSNRPPSPEELAKGLEKANQLWIIGGAGVQLTAAHVQVIRRFFEQGHGLYLWGDNPPYQQDANLVARALFDVAMSDDFVQGEKVVSMQHKLGEPGVLPNHLLTTGIEHLYEGHTIPTLSRSSSLSPLIIGSAGNLVAAFYDHGGKRAIIDGGYTRLYLQWDTAGTGRYVKNAAAWLANAERFGDKIVAKH